MYEVLLEQQSTMCMIKAVSMFLIRKKMQTLKIFQQPNEANTVLKVCETKWPLSVNELLMVCVCLLMCT